MTLELRLEWHDSVPVARVKGEVDIATSDQLRDELLGQISNREFVLVLDLSQATYLDSAGVNVMFELAERLGSRQQQLVVVTPESGLVTRVLKLVDASSAMSIKPTLEDALEHAGALESDVIRSD